MAFATAANRRAWTYALGSAWCAMQVRARFLISTAVAFSTLFPGCHVLLSDDFAAVDGVPDGSAARAGTSALDFGRLGRGGANGSAGEAGVGSPTGRGGAIGAGGSSGSAGTIGSAGAPGRGGAAGTNGASGRAGVDAGSDGCPPSTTPPGGSCPAVCSGGCAAGVCTINCDAEQECKGRDLQCPPEFACVLRCAGKQSCQDTALTCSATHACRIECTGEQACAPASADCGAGSCELVCAPQACKGMKLRCSSGSCSARCDSTAAGERPTVERCNEACRCTRCM